MATAQKQFGRGFTSPLLSNYLAGIVHPKYGQCGEDHCKP